MSDGQIEPQGKDSLESSLRLELTRGGSVVGAVGPVLRHLVQHGDGGLFADGVIAQVRACLHDLARQLAGDDAQRVDPLAAALVDVPGILGHLHGLALEWAMTCRLQERLGIDPVLSPLLQSLIASSEPETSARAMALLAAQARFVRSGRRLQLPLRELPAELWQGAVEALRGLGGEFSQVHDEASTRAGLLARLVSGMGSGAVAGLALGHAGVAIFATCLAYLGPHWHDRARDGAILAMQEGQELRLAVALRAAGLKMGSVEENLLALHPGASLSWGMVRLSVERAGEILADHPLTFGNGL
jgi:hypothetical protein